MQQVETKKYRAEEQLANRLHLSLFPLNLIIGHHVEGNVLMLIVSLDHPLLATSLLEKCKGKEAPRLEQTQL